jgi:hypothetical protein
LKKKNQILVLLSGKKGMTRGRDREENEVSAGWEGEEMDKM